MPLFVLPLTASWWRREAVFPLRPERRYWTTRVPASSRLSAPRVACEPNGITRTRSRRSASSFPGICRPNSPAALFVAYYVYNTVVLESLGQKDESRVRQDEHRGT